MHPPTVEVKKQLVEHVVKPSSKVVPTVSAKSTPIKSPEHKKPRACEGGGGSGMARSLAGELAAVVTKCEPKCAGPLSPPILHEPVAHGATNPVTWMPSHPRGMLHVFM